MPQATTTKLLDTCPGCFVRCAYHSGEPRIFDHHSGCAYANYRSQAVLEMQLQAEARQGDRSESEPNPAGNTPVCKQCGSLIGDPDKHAQWHIELIEAHQRNRSQFRSELLP